MQGLHCSTRDKVNTAGLWQATASPCAQGSELPARVRYLRVRYHVLDFWRDLEGFKLLNLPWVNILLQLPGALLIGQ